MNEKFNPGFWYSFADAPKVELPAWLIVTDGKQAVPAFWSPRDVSEYFPDGGVWELLLNPTDCGGEEMGEYTHFMMPPRMSYLSQKSVS